MKEKKTFWQSAERFLAGKGFYIVLFLCVAVIGVSAWILLFSGGEDGEWTDVISLTENLTDTGNTASPSPDASNDADLGAAIKPVVSAAPPAQDLAEKDETEADTDSEDAGSDAENPSEDTPNAGSETDAEETLSEDVTFIWPLAGEISAAYSMDELAYSKTMGDWRTHSGVDISAQIGTKVMAVASGVVAKVYEDEMFGMTVVIDHGAGVCSVYSNLAGTPNVAEGDSVSMGDVIGAVGDTAIGETGEVAHLHFAMTNGAVYVSPHDYLPER